MTAHRAEESVPPHFFVWAKMEAAGGETLTRIVMRKEAERKAGAGSFWWGIGSSLGRNLIDVATAAGGTLPVLFSKMVSKPKPKDAAPEGVCVWKGWQRIDGESGSIPEHVLVTGGSDPSRSYYALCCMSDAPLVLAAHGAFDPNLCRTLNDKAPGSSQVTSLLRDTNPSGHLPTRYANGFKARLVWPWSVRLIAGRLLTGEERIALDNFDEGDDWRRLVRSLRGGQ